jgi:hypothetical protein
MILLHASTFSLMSRTASRCFSPWDSGIKIEPELHFVRHRVVQSLVEGLGTRLDRVLRFKFTTQEVSVVEFDPNEITAELQSHLAASGRATGRIENDASADRRKVGLPSTA